MLKLFNLYLFCYCLWLPAKGQIRDSINLPDATLYYTVYGAGKPVLLLAGGPGASPYMLEPIAQTLSKDCKAIVFEQRGTGNSWTKPLDSNTINLKKAVEDLSILKKRLSIKKFSIIGHSWGAMLALYYATLNSENVESLILVGPGPLDAGKSYEYDNRMAKITDQEKESIIKYRDSINKGLANSKTISNLMKIYLRLDIYDSHKTDSIFPIVTKGGLPNFTVGNLMWNDLVKNYDVKAGLQKLTIPILIICGRQDPVGIFPSFQIIELNKKARINWIDQCGHFPFLEKPNDFYNSVFNFLN